MVFYLKNVDIVITVPKVLVLDWIVLKDIIVHLKLVRDKQIVLLGIIVPIHT